MKRFFAAFNTTAARLSALYLILFSACAIFLVFYMTGSAARFLARETQQAVLEEVVDLGQVYRRSGLRALVREIDRRSRRPGANLYMIADSTGRILSGNVVALQPGVLDTEGWTENPFVYARFGDEAAVINDPENAPHALAQVIAVSNGMRILVGRDLGEPARFREIVRQALITALGVMAVGGFLIWFFVGRRALQRIDRVSEASARIVAGGQIIREGNARLRAGPGTRRSGGWVGRGRFERFLVDHDAAGILRHIDQDLVAQHGNGKGPAAIGIQHVLPQGQEVIPRGAGGIVVERHAEDRIGAVLAQRQPKQAVGPCLLQHIANRVAPFFQFNHAAIRAEAGREPGVNGCRAAIGRDRPAGTAGRRDILPARLPWRGGIHAKPHAFQHLAEQGVMGCGLAAGEIDGNDKLATIGTGFQQHRLQRFLGIEIIVDEKGGAARDGQRFVGQDIRRAEQRFIGQPPVDRQAAETVGAYETELLPLDAGELRPPVRCLEHEAVQRMDLASRGR